jgi:hypothetical protein
VTAAGVLLFVAAGALLVMAASQFLIIEPVGRAVEAVSVEPGEGLAFGLIFGMAGAANAVFAVVLSILAGLDLAGKQPARIATWVVTPLALLCCGCGSGVYTRPFFSSYAGGPPTSDVDMTVEQTAAIAAGMPAWYTPAVVAAIAVLVLAGVAAMITLGVSTSRDYFRPQQQGWVPGTWPPGGLPPTGYPPSGAPPGPPGGVYPPGPPPP